MLRWSGSLVVVGVLVAAAAYELVLALRHSSSPADGALSVGLVAMLAACGLVFTRTRVSALLAPAAALFVTARFYTQDGSYSGFYRTFAMDGYPRPAFVFVMLGLSVAAGAATYRWRIPGAVLSVAVLLVLLLTATLLFGAGY